MGSSKPLISTSKLLNSAPTNHISSNGAGCSDWQIALLVHRIDNVIRIVFFAIYFLCNNSVAMFDLKEWPV